MDDARFGVGPDDSEEYDESIPAPRVHLSPRIPALKRDSIKGSASEIGDALDEMGRELTCLESGPRPTCMGTLARKQRRSSCRGIYI